jgi:hypothetical protein
MGYLENVRTGGKVIVLKTWNKNDLLNNVIYICIEILTVLDPCYTLIAIGA